MNRRVAVALMAAAVAMQACAAEPAPAPAQAFETGKLTIAGQAFAPAEVLDARALPDINKKVGILLTLTPPAAQRLGEITAALVGKPMLVALDGKALGGELIRKPLTDGTIEIPGRWNLTDAEVIARRISGKDPLPDDLGGE
ncbi:SecDF P1 head subdomain-containing protein [Rhizorhabdus argentea]|uniref:SecDF P1 head subdomain-containing protein n=1 Tax=Rhizorhabdus argentea TaxID=1387174 RepID=UPI0030EE854E